jgi:hypothetical protein
MSSPIYQDMNVAMWKHCASDSDVFRCGNIYYSNANVITIFVSTFVPNCRFKNVFSAYFGIEISLQNSRMVFWEFIKHTFQFLVEAVLPINSCPLLGNGRSEH